MIQELKNALQYKEKFVGEISKEIKTTKISKQIEERSFQEKIEEFQKKIEEQVCSTIPIAFWYKKNMKLNKVLQWIRYPIPNKQDLIKRTQ